jgi:hypothetical protein
VNRTKGLAHRLKGSRQYEIQMLSRSRSTARDAGPAGGPYPLDERTGKERAVEDGQLRVARMEFGMATGKRLASLSSTSLTGRCGGARRIGRQTRGDCQRKEILSMRPRRSVGRRAEKCGVRHDVALDAARR